VLIDVDVGNVFFKNQQVIFSCTDLFVDRR
jgi:hypothetical protein